MVDIQTVLTYLTLISVPVGVFYHIMTLNNTRKNQELTLKAQQQQLETRQAQIFMQLYNKWGDDLRESFNQITSMEYKDFADFKEKYGDETKRDMLKHISRMAYF